MLKRTKVRVKDRWCCGIPANTSLPAYDVCSVSGYQIRFYRDGGSGVIGEGYRKAAKSGGLPFSIDLRDIATPYLDLLEDEREALK